MRVKLFQRPCMRDRRKAMRNLQAVLLSGSLLAAPWVFAAGPGDQSHDGHATPNTKINWMGFRCAQDVKDRMTSSVSYTRTTGQ